MQLIFDMICANIACDGDSFDGGFQFSVFSLPDSTDRSQIPGSGIILIDPTIYVHII